MAMIDHAGDYGRDLRMRLDWRDARELLEFFEAYGLEATSDDDENGDYSTLTVKDFPWPWEVERKRTRNAGAKWPEIKPPTGSPLTAEMPADEAWEWLQAHTAKEAQEALGLSRSAYYRHLPRIKEAAERAKRQRAAGKSVEILRWC